MTKTKKTLSKTAFITNKIFEALKKSNYADVGTWSGSKPIPARQKYNPTLYPSMWGASQSVSGHFHRKDRNLVVQLKGKQQLLIPESQIEATYEKLNEKHQGIFKRTPEQELKALIYTGRQIYNSSGNILQKFEHPQLHELKTLIKEFVKELEKRQVKA